MSKSPAGTVGTPASAPGAPPPATATPPPGAAKKKRVRAPAADGATPPPAKKPKKTEASPNTEAAPKKTAAKRKPKESEDADEQEVGEKEQERRLALIEAEELEMKSVVEEDTDANTWQDNTIKQGTVSDGQYEDKLTTLYALMTPEQQERYSKFRASGISDTEFSDEVLKPLGLHASAETSTVMRAIGKLFIGELIDAAQTVMQEWDDVGPIRPVHLREAYQRMEERGGLPNTPKTQKFGLRR